MQMNKSKNITIIGAGPAGLMAAELLARANHRVTLYDRMPSPARKFLIAGRGGLNLTHSEPLEIFITRYGSAADWLAPFIHGFPPTKLRQWCESLGVKTFVGSSGRVFPKNMKAVQLLRAWLKRLDELGVNYLPRHTWLGWEQENLKFQNADQKMVLVKPDATLLALGGASWPRLGSDGSWTTLFPDNVITPLEPSNCGFITQWSQHFSERYAGHPLKPIAITHAGVTRQGEAMITAKGIEGGVIYALSANLRETIKAHGETTITLDFRPSIPVEALKEKLTAHPRGSKSLSTYLRALGLSPQMIGLLRERTEPAILSKADAAELAALIKCVPISLTATAGITRAISSAGGIKHSELNEDLMLKNKPGIFIAGEMLDWEAPTGGYLLQACFSTGNHAANGILRYLKSSKH